MMLIAVAGVMIVAATVWHVTQRLSPLDLLMVARATGSARACVGYILFCLRHED
jgi:hypothetical protein